MAVLQMDLKRNSKSELYIDRKDQGAVKPELLLLLSLRREKLLGPSGFLILLVSHIFVYISVWKREEKRKSRKWEKKLFCSWCKTEGTVCGEQPKKLRILIVCPILAVSSVRARKESVLIYLLLVWLSSVAGTLQVTVSNTGCHFRW